jgi:hypothetical protein
VSATDIINELPKLSESERRLIRRRLLELGQKSEEVELCNQSALEGAMMLDRLETEDAANQSR